MYVRVFFVDKIRLLLNKMTITITVIVTNTTAAVALMTAISVLLTVPWSLCPHVCPAEVVGAATTGDSALVDIVSAGKTTAAAALMTAISVLLIAS